MIRGNSSLTDRARAEARYLKPCYFAAIACVLAKIGLDADCFRASTLDRLILLAEEMAGQVGALRHKECRWFYNVSVLDATYDIVLRESVHADPEGSPSDELDGAVERFLERDRTGILALENCAYAFWTTADDEHYLFDPYPCDERGRADEDGGCCLARFRDLRTMLGRVKENAGETAGRSYRLYTVCVTRMRAKTPGRREKRRGAIGRRRRHRRHPRAKREADVRVRDEAKRDALALLPVEPETSLIELAEWVTSDPELDSRISDYDIAIARGFAPLRRHGASILEAIVLRDDITTPVFAPFRRSPRGLTDNDDAPAAGRETPAGRRRRTRERIFRNHTSLAIPIDICVMAWSLVHDPASWSARTIEGLLEASADYALDSVLACEDTSVNVDMTDALLPEFEIANYAFRAVFVPLHYGTLYATEGWNLAMTLRKVFEAGVYAGAIVVCRYAHVGVARRGKNYFAWWTVTGTKSLRMIVSGDMGEFLKLIVKEIDAPREAGFAVRVITVSYARKTAPDCSDVQGLHEPITPANLASLAEIHRRDEARDFEGIFRPIAATAAKPIFVAGTVALSDRDGVTEPRAKRCYFVALLAVVIKRDIVQSPLPDMIDKVLEVAEDLYRSFSEPKFHAEHILRNVPLMNRLFDLRDCASPLVTLTTTSSRPGRDDLCAQVSETNDAFFFIALIANARSESRGRVFYYFLCLCLIYTLAE